jgi:hypothetical protein
MKYTHVPGRMQPRPNNLSLVCLYLSLYISFLLFGHFFYFSIFIFLTHCVSKKNVQIIKRKYIMTNIDTQETDYSVYMQPWDEFHESPCISPERMILLSEYFV